MATKLLPGGITIRIRKIEQADNQPHVLAHLKPKLVVTEYGDTRCLPISRKVAEVLIANGFSVEG